MKKTTKSEPVYPTDLSGLGEQVIFLKLYNDMVSLPKGPRVRILKALLKALQ